jgi:hypothetical protein
MIRRWVERPLLPNCSGFSSTTGRLDAAAGPAGKGAHSGKDCPMEWAWQWRTVDRDGSLSGEASCGER